MFGISLFSFTRVSTFSFPLHSFQLIPILLFSMKQIELSCMSFRANENSRIIIFFFKHKVAVWNINIIELDTKEFKKKVIE